MRGLVGVAIFTKNGRVASLMNDIEQKFQESCNTLTKQVEKSKSTAAWVWANTPEDQKQQVIEKFEHQFGIILKEKLKMNE